MGPENLTPRHDAAPSPPSVPAWLRGSLPVLIDLGFAALTLLIVALLWRGLSVWLALAAQLGVLAAWDLSRYAQRLSAATADLGHHTRRHLWLLAGALAAGAVAALAALALRLDLGFGVALVLGVALIVLLARGVVMGLDRAGDPDLGARRE